MKITNSVHQIKIPFQVTPVVSRYVYVYLIEGQKCYLVDSGVAGSEKAIEDYMHSIGRDLSEIKMILLTHAHPDHIGSAAAIKEKTGCRVAASRGEAPWIEDIDLQFQQRPIPNFYNLVNRSTEVTDILSEEQRIELEPGITMICKGTAGHSADCLSFYYEEEKTFFSGDSIPVEGDIPIYISSSQSLETLYKIRSMKEADFICPAWDRVYEKDEINAALNSSISYLNKIGECVSVILAKRPDTARDEVFQMVCEQLDMAAFQANPLFKVSIASHVEESQYYNASGAGQGACIKS